jgi:hypothetical protein
MTNNYKKLWDEYMVLVGKLAVGQDAAEAEK